MKIRKRICFLFVAVCYCAPAIPSQTVPAADRDVSRIRDQAFISYNPRYIDLRAERIRRAQALGKRVFQREAQGRNTACAHQILTETKWLLGDTAEFQRIDQRLDALENVLEHPDLEDTATRQDPSDGSWGRCYTEWFFKLDASYEHLNRDATRNLEPDLPLRLLDRINSPTKLRDYFDRVSVSDIARDGVDNSRELNESMADLMRLILWDRPKGYSWDPRLKHVVMDIILHSLRNPETGWWGERYVLDGHTVFVDYLSLTFHIVRYLDGKVPELGRMIETTLALKNLNEPSGWLSDGHFTDHNNMDVAVLFQFGWNAASDSQREAMAEQIQKMLDWCLAQSLQADGTFAQGGDDSIEQNLYFGVAFLSRIGFFDRRRRCWTQHDFPEAPEIRQRITGYILRHRDSGAAGGTYYEHALQELDSDPAYLKSWSKHPD
ncbi:MAG: hypothetical protein WBE76_30260 [Terracidiphilus sp.]